MHPYNKIAVIGASGSTGKEVVKRLLERRYDVVIVARNPEKFSTQQHVEVVKGDVTEDLSGVLKGVDAVISCFGPQNGRKPGNMMSTGVKNIISSCQKNNIKRFVFMSGILQTSGKELSPLNSLAIKIIRQFYQEGFKDKTIAEKEIMSMKNDFVIVRAVGLGDKPAESQYLAGPEQRVQPFSPLSYGDCALCLVDALENESWTNKIINVGKSSTSSWANLFRTWESGACLSAKQGLPVMILLQQIAEVRTL